MQSESSKPLCHEVDEVALLQIVPAAFEHRRNPRGIEFVIHPTVKRHNALTNAKAYSHKPTHYLKTNSTTGSMAAPLLKQ